MCVVSDRNESIIKVVSIVYPIILHLTCIWHLWKNVYTCVRKSIGRLSEAYHEMSKTYRQEDFIFYGSSWQGGS